MVYIAATHFLKQIGFLATLLRPLVPWPSTDIQGKFYEYRPRGTPHSGGGIKHEG